jgi:hypothetical protein
MHQKIRLTASLSIPMARNVLVAVGDTDPLVGKEKKFSCLYDINSVGIGVFKTSDLDTN